MGSGIAPFLLSVFEFFTLLPSPLVDLATSRGREACNIEAGDGLVDEGIAACVR